MAASAGHVDGDKLEGWSCPICTYVNLPLRPGCEQCSNARPDNYLIPYGYRTTVQEKYISEGHHETIVYMEQVIAAELDAESHEWGEGNNEKQSQIDSKVARELQALDWQGQDALVTLPGPNMANEEFNALLIDDAESPPLATVQVVPLQVAPPQPVYPIGQEEPLASLDGLIMSDRDFDESDYELLHRLEDQIGEAKQRGMSSHMIKQLPVRTFSTRTMRTVKGESEAPKCLICLEDFTHQDKLYVLPCGHEFHLNCTKNWLQNKAVCPVCNKEVTPAAPSQWPVS